MWRTSYQPQAFIAELDAGSRQWKAPRRLTLDANANIADAWTSDSKAVLFVSNRNNTWKLFKQGIDETTAQVLVEGHSIFLPRLSADGSQVLYLVSSRPDDVSFPASLVSKPLVGGPPHVVLQEKGIINFQCARAPRAMHVQQARREGLDLCLLRSRTWRGSRTRRGLRSATPTGAFLRMGRSWRSSLIDIESDSFRSTRRWLMMSA